MATRRPVLRALPPSAPSKRNFATSRPLHKLGAATYAQEWNTGTYHYNKSTAKLAPFAHQQTDKLLQHYITQQKKSGGGYANKAAIASHRRKYEKVYVSGSRVKDFGGHVEVEAYVFDAQKAAEKEQRARQVARGGQGQGKGEGGARGQGGAQKGGAR